MLRKKKKDSSRIVRVIGVKKEVVKKEFKKNPTALRDEELYLESFNSSNHECEECGTSLPNEFRDEDQKIIARWRYSHIIPKSIAPDLRHSVENINNLCLNCHSEWENGFKAGMRIFAKNLKKFPNYLSKFTV